MGEGGGTLTVEAVGTGAEMGSVEGEPVEGEEGFRAGPWSQRLTGFQRGAGWPLGQSYLLVSGPQFPPRWYK